MEWNGDSTNENSIWDTDTVKFVLDLVKILIVSVVAIVTLKSFASDVAIVTNANFPELRQATKDARPALKPSGKGVSSARFLLRCDPAHRIVLDRTIK